MVYWKWIEKAYIDKLYEYFERIVAIEKRTFFEVENEELKRKYISVQLFG